MNKNTKGQNVMLYYSRYAYKNHSIVKNKIIWDGKLTDCPKDLLEGVKVAPKQRYIRIWTT